MRGTLCNISLAKADAAAAADAATDVAAAAACVAASAADATTTSADAKPTALSEVFDTLALVTFASPDDAAALLLSTDDIFKNRTDTVLVQSNSW